MLSWQSSSSKNNQVVESFAIRDSNVDQNGHVQDYLYQYLTSLLNSRKDSAISRDLYSFSSSLVCSAIATVSYSACSSKGNRCQTLPLHKAPSFENKCLYCPQKHGYPACKGTNNSKYLPISNLKIAQAVFLAHYAYIVYLISSGLCSSQVKGNR